MRIMPRFLLQVLVVGITAALALLLLMPEQFGQNRPVVKIRSGQTANYATGMRGPASYAESVASATPAVVNIYTRKKVTEQVHPFLDDPLFKRYFGHHFPPREREQTSLGSGVILSRDGYVLTNYHVIQNAEAIELMLNDGRRSEARLIGSDPETDLAVLRVPLRDLPTITLGQSQDLQVGDVVLAIGNPFGVGQTVTLGIVSATGRNRLGINTFENFIQTDAAINPGNSGGALINAHGELVGINTAIYSRSGGSQGIGFAIPARLAHSVMTQIIEQGQVVRGWLGIEAQGLSPRLAASFGLDEPHGILIAGVVDNGPADQAGLKPGDIITHIDGKTVPRARDALDSITRHQPGERLRLRGIRQGKPYRAVAVVAQRPRLGK